ncbi:MAG TPA: HmuY family protein, partial [Cytophagales bacterium]|nr:HmuY family protein [Cytophagales bacterium]
VYSGLRAMRVPYKNYKEVTLADTASAKFSNKANSIGYDWKTFDLNTGLYTIHDEMTYIIHDAKGFYYKLHFVDFYNGNGEKGYPTFEYQKL